MWMSANATITTNTQNIWDFQRLELESINLILAVDGLKNNQGVHYKTIKI